MLERERRYTEGIESFAMVLATIARFVVDARLPVLEPRRPSFRPTAVPFDEPVTVADAAVRTA